MSDAPFGFCPYCGAPGKERETAGNIRCVNGHNYSKIALSAAPGSQIEFFTPMSLPSPTIGHDESTGHDESLYALHLSQEMLRKLDAILSAPPIQIARLQLNPEDVLVLQAEHKFSSDAAHGIREHFDNLGIKNKVMLLDGGVKLVTVLSPPPIPSSARQTYENCRP